MTGSILSPGQLGFCLGLLRHLGQIPPSGVNEPVADLFFRLVSMPKTGGNRNRS